MDSYIQGATAVWKVWFISLRPWSRRGGPFLKNLVLFHVFLLALLVGLNLDKLSLEDFDQTVPALAGTLQPDPEPAWWRRAFLAVNLPGHVWEAVLNNGLTVLTVASEQKQAWEVSEPEGLLGSAVFTFTNINVFDPKTYLTAQLSTLSSTDEEIGRGMDVPSGPATLPKDNTPSATLPLENIHGGTAKGNPMVGIYNTHNAETYIPTDGKSKLEGKNGGVALVAQELANTLEKAYGVPTVYTDRIHDYPDFTKSYVNSAQTIKYLLKTYPSLEILIDVHRDAMPSNDNSEAVEIEGAKAARILFIVGTDARSPHPNWRQNDQFAEELAKKTEELYPGLLKGVRRKEGTYNQTLHPRAILVEIGNDRNSLEEALISARCLARVIKEVLSDLPAKSP